MKRILPILFALFLPAVSNAAEPRVRIGSKTFTESVILGEMLAQSARSAGADAWHRRELGGTEIVWQSLVQGEIDAYPEYTGTLTQQILAGRGIQTFDELVSALGEFGIRTTAPLGFNNTYALGVPRERAEELDLQAISDLADHPDLRLGFGFEFLERSDGWVGLKRLYGLPHEGVRGVDHMLAYEAVRQGTIDVMDLYSTDPEIRAYDLVTLEDDRNYFRRYEAIVLYREDLGQRAPDAVEMLHRLEGRIDNETMMELNARAKIDRQPETRIAVEFLNESLGLDLEVETNLFAEELWRRTSALLVNTREHLLLAGISLFAAVSIAIPLGVFAYRFQRLSGTVMAVVGVIQTMPSLALFVFMIPLFGLGALPAIVALFLYSLLPIVRNTLTGLEHIPLSLKESAEVLGLTSRQRLWLVELPMASPSIVAGIKTAAVINVGTATLGALIGAGGFGQPILTGLRLGRDDLLLQGAIPAAVLALLVQYLFGVAERWVIPRGLRLKTE